MSCVLANASGLSVIITASSCAHGTRPSETLPLPNPKHTPTKAAKAKAQQERAQKERQRLKRQTKKADAEAAAAATAGAAEGGLAGRKRGRSMGGVMVGAGELSEEGGNSEAETSLEDLTDHGEEWEFACRCGEACTSQSPADAWPQGALFQCKGACVRPAVNGSLGCRGAL